ncbi:T9SS type A sorting domain-containing protein [bacterium]|nr:T9SS type A sorting domain-containing protein [bacterium]
MKKVLKFVGIFGCLVFGANLGFTETKEWTFAVYLDGDNDLEDAAIDDFFEMAKTGSSDKINIVVQFDRVDGYNESYGDWTGTTRFCITKNMTPIAENGTDIGEANMGATQTLIEFVDWAKTNYPAKRYALVLWNHGGGWRKTEVTRPKAVCWDDTDGDCLYMNEVKEALSKGGADVIGFDACLMGMVEVAYEIKDYGTVAVFSQELEPEDGWPYETILDDLTGTPTMEAKELGKVIVERYMESYDYPDVTQSAVCLKQLGTVATKISNFADSLKYDYDKLRSLRANTDDCGAYADIYYFADLVSSNISDQSIQGAANQLKSALSESIIAEGHGGDHPNFHGMNIYFPEYKDEEYDDYVVAQVVDFPKDTAWDEFLIRYFGILSNAMFTGSFTDTGIDTDNDSKYNYLELSLEVNVREGGDYGVGVSLELGNIGIGIGTYQFLMPGTQTINFRFPGEDIFERGINGPYKFIARIDRNGLMDSFSGYTGTYTYTQFEVPGLFTGTYTDYGIDTNNNGLYDWLVIEPEVLIPEDGCYQISSNLYDQYGQSFAWSCNGMEFSQGTHTLQINFSGRDIYSSRIDGPYFFDLWIYSPTKGSTYTTKLKGLTGTYTYTQFETAGILTGSISYSGTKTGTLYVLLCDEPEMTENSIVYDTIIKTPAFPQSYEIRNINSGTYYVAALLDVDDNEEPSMGDLVGIYGTLTTVLPFWQVIGTPTPVQIQEGSITYGIDFALTQGIIASVDAWDPTDDTASEATLLTPTNLEQSHGQHTLSSTDLYDWYKIDMTSGITYNFNTIGGSGDNYGELYNGPGDSYIRVASDDDSGGNNQFKFSYQAENTQYYYLRIRTYSSGRNWSGYLRYSCTGPIEKPNIISVSNAEGGFGETITVPIRIQKNSLPIDTFGLDLIYDNTMLSFVGISKGDVTSHFMYLDGIEIASGTIRIRGFDPKPIPTDSTGIIAEVVFSVISEEEATSTLYLLELKYDIKGFGVIPGIFNSYPHHGDVNNDSEITMYDALIAFEAYLGLYAPTNWQKSVADRNRDGEVTPEDALITFKEFLGIKPLLARKPIKLNSTQIISVRGATGAPNSSVVIHIDLEGNDRQIDAFGLELLYDPNILVYKEAKTTILTENPSFFGGSLVSTGTLRIGWFRTAAISPDSTGSSVEIIFDIKPDAVGSCDLILSNLKDDIKTAGTISGKFIVKKVLADNLLDVIVYPNPCKDYDRITFKNLPAQATIRIFNVAGEEVERLYADNECTWTLPPKLSSGVYIYLITNNKNQKATGKIGIVK